MRILTKLTIASSLLLLAACGGAKKYEVQGSNKAPGADAKITTEFHKDQNHSMLTIAATDLPPPDRVAHGSRFYTAWYRSNEEATWSRLGNLKYDEGSRKGDLEATTPEASFDLKISAEATDAQAEPSNSVIFQKRVSGT